MHCTNCGQETEVGKFCTHCGAKLASEESAAAIDTTGQQGGSTGQVQSNEFVEKLQKTGSSFGQYFLTLMKKPSEAKKVNSNDLVSGIITIAIYSLLIAICAYSIAKITSFGFGVSFGEYFLLPFIQFVILFGIVAALTFIGVKLTGNNLSFTDVLAKYAAYLVPFLLIFIAGVILLLIKLPSLPALILLVSILGPLLVIPTLILLEQASGRYDHLYVLIGIYLVALFAFSMLVQKLVTSILGSLFGGIMSLF